MYVNELDALHAKKKKIDAVLSITLINQLCWWSSAKNHENTLRRSQCREVKEVCVYVKKGKKSSVVIRALK